jgi:hypothetical protein
MLLSPEQNQIHVSSHPTAEIRPSDQRLDQIHRKHPFLIENFDANFLLTGLESIVASTYIANESIKPTQDAQRTDMGYVSLNLKRDV